MTLTEEEWQILRDAADSYHEWKKAHLSQPPGAAMKTLKEIDNAALLATDGLSHDEYIKALIRAALVETRPKRWQSPTEPVHDDLADGHDRCIAELDRNAEEFLQ